MRTVRIILTIVVIPALIVAFFSVTIYAGGMDNRLTRSFNKNFSFLPAAVVAGKFVFLGEVDKQSRMYENAVNFQSKDLVADSAAPRAAILQTLIDQEIVRDLLGRKNNAVRPQELDDYYQHIAAQFETKNVFEIFGVSESEFKKTVVLPDLEEKKLRVAVYAEAVESKERQRAVKIKQLIDDGLDFSEAVKSYSEDENSKYIDGDLGFKSEGQLGPWLAVPAFGLQASSTSAVTVSPEGYHIMRVMGRDLDASPQEIQVQHIFIRGFDFEEYLDNQKKNYRIYTFLRD